MKKIGILFFTDKSDGGVFQYTESIISNLNSNDRYKFIIFCNKNDKKTINKKLEIRFVDIPNITFYNKTFIFIKVLFGYQNRGIINESDIKKYEDIDIFICPFVSFNPHIYIKKKYIFTLHDMQERYLPSYFSIKQRFKRLFMNFILSREACGILCESKYVKDDIKRFLKVKSSKIHVIPFPPINNFLKFKFNNEYSKYVISKYKLPEKYIYYPANFWFHKNHVRLLDAFKIISESYNDIYLILTGSKKANSNEVIKKIGKLNLQNKVKILGYLDKKDIPYIYKLSQMLIMPSLFESISIPIYEAFSLKVPVCSSNILGLKDQVGCSGTLFNPYDVNDIAEKIEYVLINRNLVGKKVDSGYKKIIEIRKTDYNTKVLDIIDKCVQ